MIEGGGGAGKRGARRTELGHIEGLVLVGAGGVGVVGALVRLVGQDGHVVVEGGLFGHQ